MKISISIIEYREKIVYYQLNFTTIFFVKQFREFQLLILIINYGFSLLINFASVFVLL